MTPYSSQTAAGPSLHAPWQDAVGTDSFGKALALLAIPDATNEQRVREGLRPVKYCVLAQPTVAKDTNGTSKMSLTFVLDRIPEPHQKSLAPYIQRAVLGFDVTLASPVAVLNTLSSDGEDHQPLFATEASFCLSSSGESDLADRYAEAVVRNGQLTAGLNATFDRPQALQLLDALNGLDSPFVVNVEAAYRVAEQFTALRFTTDLAQVYEYLSCAYHPAYDIFYVEDLRNHLAVMLAQGIVAYDSAAVPETLEADELVTATLPAFLRAASMLLRPTDEGDQAIMPRQGYTLNVLTVDSMVVRFRVRLYTSDGGKLTLQRSLHELLPEALQGQNTDALINLVALDEGGGGMTPLPRRVRNKPTKAGPPSDKIVMAALGNSVVSLSSAVRPASTVAAPAHVILASQPMIGRIDHLSLDKINIVLAADPDRHLPVIDKKRNGLWPDKIDENTRYWYAPAYEVVLPTAVSQASNSPFLFSYRTVGYDMAGRPGLEATVQVTLRRIIPAPVKAKLDRLGNVRADPVATHNLSFALEIPFRNEHGQKKVERILATSIEKENQQIVVTFQLLNDWVRLSYGALAYRDFQPGEQARISTGYTFEAYIPLKDRRIELASGGKSFKLPVVTNSGTRAKPTRRVHVTAKDGVVHLPGREMRVSTVKNDQVSRPRPSASTVSLAPLSSVSVASTNVVIRPEVHLAEPIEDVIVQKKYAVSTQAWSVSADILVPCNTFGALYVEQVEAGQRVIGCQDTFRLGQAEYRLYEELLLNKSGYRVFRSLQTPGRFVVVPDVYAISRFAPTEGDKAYRPVILLYSTIDIENLQNSRCVFLATLQPDLPASERLLLQDELRRNHHPNASLQYFTELEGELRVDWALPATGAGGFLSLEVQETRLWDSFEVSLATDAIGVPQLQAILGTSGISGSATLSLPDGTSLRTTLRMKLSQIVGPWQTGPLEITTDAGGTVTLRNHIETAVNISELLLSDGEVVESSMPVGRQLAPAATTQVSLDVTPAEVLPVYSVEPSPTSLTEIRSYIEDIAINVVLVNRLDFATPGLKQVQIIGSVQGVPGTVSAGFTPDSPSAASLDFLLPLTSYITDPVINFQVTVTNLQNQEQALPGWDWPLHSNGVVVELTQDLVGL